MRRILALVCIFILLLFTGMPMFTSNLLCNETRVYADTPQISDNEKIRSAITVYLNSKGAYLSSNGIQMDAVMSLMQAQIDDFIATGVYVGGTLYDTAALILDIGITTSPLTVILKAGAVSFFNQFLQWLIDEGKITSGNSTDNLYNGYTTGNSLYYIAQVSRFPNSENFYLAGNLNKLTHGTPVSGTSYDILLNHYLNYNHATLEEFNDSNNDNFSNDPYGEINYFSDYSRNIVLNRYVGGSAPTLNVVSNLSAESINLTGDSSVYAGNARNIYSTYRNTRGNPAYLMLTYNGVNRCYCGFICVRNDYFSMWGFHRITVEGNSQVGTANIDFNKDDFDTSPTTPPSGSDGLSYQPKQNGTGNTYNTYNDYYQDWHEGDTYIYYPSDGGGGDDPGGGGEEPTPGGTTPPWDGTQNPGTPAGTLTPVEGGGYNFNLPDLGLPDLDIDWSINGLKEKFPFSIPWDLMAFFAVMNAEPETPYIQADIPLGLWEWNIDWDLHAFDNVARILRNMELIGFCIGLILITRSIIKG